MRLSQPAARPRALGVEACAPPASAPPSERLWSLLGQAAVALVLPPMRPARSGSPPAAEVLPPQDVARSCRGLRNLQPPCGIRDRGCTSTAVAEDAFADGHEIGARERQWLDLVERPGKSNAGYFEKVRPPFNPFPDSVE